MPSLKRLSAIQSADDRPKIAAPLVSAAGRELQSRQVSGFSPKSTRWPLHGWVRRVVDHAFSRSDLVVPNPPSISPPFGRCGTSLRPAADLETLLVKSGFGRFGPMERRAVDPHPMEDDG